MIEQKCWKGFVIEFTDRFPRSPPQEETMIDTNMEIDDLRQMEGETMPAYLARTQTLLRKSHGSDPQAIPGMPYKPLDKLSQCHLDRIIEAFLRGLKEKDLMMEAISASALTCKSLRKAYEIVIPDLIVRKIGFLIGHRPLEHRSLDTVRLATLYIFVHTTSFFLASQHISANSYAAKMTTTNEWEFVSDPSAVSSAFATTPFSGNTSRRVLTDIDYNVLLAQQKNVILSHDSVEEAFKFIRQEIEIADGTVYGSVHSGGFSESDVSLYHAYDEIYPLWEAGKMKPAQCSNSLADTIAEINLRFEYQSIIASIVGDLWRSEALSPDCVKYPISWTELRRDSAAQPSHRIYNMLYMFDLPKLFARIFREKEFNLFDTPIEWLALMITRGATSIAAVHEALVLNKKLGTFDVAKLIRKDPTLLELHQGLGDIKTHENNIRNLPPRVGWLLPSAIEGDYDIMMWQVSSENRMERVGRLFVLAFGETAQTYDEIYANVGPRRIASASSFGSLGLHSR